MNHVFLSGVAVGAAREINWDDDIQHVLMELSVSHRTAAGLVKKELYPINAWRMVAQRMLEQVKPGSRITVSGYLTQRGTFQGTRTEITAEEFTVGAGAHQMSTTVVDEAAQ